MTLKTKMLTPQAMLSAPRRSPGVPNLEATKVLYTVSTYSFETHRKTTEFRCIDTESKESTVITNEEGISDFVWLEGEEHKYACLRSGKKGSTEVIIGSVAKGSSWKNAKVAAQIDGPTSNLKVARLGDGAYALVFSAQAHSDGSLYNPEAAPKLQSDGRLYKSLFVRHWDHYVGSERNTLWYGILKKSKQGEWALTEPINALKDTGLESPAPPFGGTDHFDVSSRRVTSDVMY